MGGGETEIFNTDTLEKFLCEEKREYVWNLEEEQGFGGSAASTN